MYQKSEQLTGGDHYIVAIGASAGGLEAIHEFFDNMPSNGNLSFVLIQHLSSDYKSLLVELVAKHTNMKVVEAQQDMEVERDYIYVIPNNKLLTLQNGRLQLSDKNIEKAPNTAIDTFLKSLAEDQGSKAIAVILSGTGTDGTRGIEVIQNEGGMVLVQDPLSAKFDGMPNSAITSGYVDYIMAPELMPEEIFNYIKERPVRVAAEGKPDESLLPEVLKLVDKHCNYDFFNYKTPTILRRIGRRMIQLGYTKFTDYLEHLKNSSEECRILGKEFLIGVTKFFRDKAAFDILRDEVLPAIIFSKREGEMLKVWVSACSTGQEAYSMAMLIDDVLQKRGKYLEVKIFATDIDLDSIEFASKGTYPEESIAEIDEELAKKYFTRQGGMVTVSPELRKQIVFARHNILKDPPFIKNDLASCRNMLIYMNVLLQRKVLSTLQFSLNTGGYLFLGPSEIPSSVREGFEDINGKWKIYRKVSNDNSYNPERFPSTQILRQPREMRYPSKENSTLHQLSEDFKTILTEEYGFAALYLDNNLEIKEAVGDFKKYLSLPDRIASLHLLKMVDPELALVLNTATRKAVKENSKITLNNIRLKREGQERNINIFVRPSSRDGYMLVVFGEGHEVSLLKHVPEFVPQNPGEASSYISELEEELKETRATLQLTVESLETANEELQSSNEELLSANEELQSSNEELQSLNEELHTLNTEHQLRIKELIELNDDLNNYFRSNEIAQVFVDNSLRIRKFNPTAVKMINLIESDIGRPIDHISTNITNSTLVANITTSIKEGRVIEKEVVLNNGGISLMRIMPYIRQDKTTDGAVITFIDISRMRELDNIIKGVFNSSLSAIMAFHAIRDHKKTIIDFLFIAANAETDMLLNKTTEDYIGKTLKEQFPELAKKSLWDRMVKVVETAGPLRTELQLVRNGEITWHELIATQMMDGLVITLTNVTEKKKAEEKFKQNYHELIKTKESYRNLNIALEEKVQERTYELAQSEERFRLIANATNDAIWDWDLVNNQLWWSDSFYNLFGYSKEDSNTIDFWLTHIHPDDRQQINEKLNEAINLNADWSAQYRFQKADGSYASILDRGRVLTNAQGTPYRLIGAMMDISDTELAKQKIRSQNDELRTLIEEFKFVTDFIPQMVWATQKDGNSEFFNKRWYDYTGLSFDQIKSHTWQEVLHPEDRERAWQLWRHSLETGELFEIEYRLRRNDGAYRWFLGRGLPLKDDNGAIIKWFGTCTDIHDQKLMNDILEQKVKERTEELQESNNELLQFASVASHDLKEPLRKIIMFSNLVKDRHHESLPASALEYVNKIISSSTRMGVLVNDLLSFTKLSVHNNRFQCLDLNTIVSEVLSDLELTIREKKAIIDVGDLPSVEIIPGQMRQVFQNIISNALKFTKEHVTPHIEISSARVSQLSFVDSFDKEGAYARITIQDNGIGFDNEYAEKIFTIFQRLHTQRKYEGTGIGLAIARKIISKHNGIITATGKAGEGARFIIVVPLAQPEDVKAPKGSSAQEMSKN